MPAVHVASLPSVSKRVEIGRASRPFPLDEPCVPLSRHTALTKIDIAPARLFPWSIPNFALLTSSRSTAIEVTQGCCTRPDPVEGRCHREGESVHAPAAAVGAEPRFPVRLRSCDRIDLKLRRTFSLPSRFTSPDPRQHPFGSGITLSARLLIPVAFRRAAFASWIIPIPLRIERSLRFASCA